jgi:hypothetical protein
MRKGMPKESFADRIMSIDEFATWSNLSKRSAYREISEGRLRARKCVGRTLISMADALAWFQSLPITEVKSDRPSINGEAA